MPISKIKLIKNKPISNKKGLIKYSSNVNGIYIYEAQLGFGHHKYILKAQKDSRYANYGESSVIITYSDLIDSEIPINVEKITYTVGLKTYYTI